MGNSLLQLIALAAVAVFLIVKLRNTLGTRDGFENLQRRKNPQQRGFDVPAAEKQAPVIDREISRYIDTENDHSSANALASMKSAEKNFSVADFMDGAGQAYEMILLAFANGKLDELEDFVSDDVYDSFSEIVSNRSEDGLLRETKFIGLRETRVRNASFEEPHEAEITVEFVAELISYAVNADGELKEGSDEMVRRQHDVWTFARRMGSSDPNWTLVATGE